MDILDPRWAEDTAAFAVDLRQWETLVRVYEDQAMTELDSVRHLAAPRTTPGGETRVAALGG